MDNRPRYMISVAAELVGMHPQTLRIYEAKGLVRPRRTPGNTRLYSEADLERLRLIQRLTTELGLNLAGVETVLRLEDELGRLRSRVERLEREMREEVQRVHRQYRREVVLYAKPEETHPEEKRHGLQQADAQVPGSRRRRAGARAAERQPRDLPRAPAPRAPRPGAAADARRPDAPSLRAEAEARLAAKPAVAGRGAAAARLHGVLPGARPRVRGGARARGRVRLRRASAAGARRRPARRAARSRSRRCAARSGSPPRIPRAPTRRSRSSAAT